MEKSAIIIKMPGMKPEVPPPGEKGGHGCPNTKSLFPWRCPLCFCIGLLPAAARAAGSGIPDEELDELHDFLIQFEWGWIDRIFDFRSPTTPAPNEYGTSRSILQTLIGNGVAYAGPVPGADHFYGETDWDGKAPPGRWGSYHKTSAAWTDWVLENVFHCSQADISALRASLSGSQDGRGRRARAVSV